MVANVIITNKDGKILWEGHNIVTNGMKQFMSDRSLSVTGMRGEYGAYAEGGGPYFVPAITDTIDDLGTNELYPIYSTEVGTTTTKYISFFTSQDGSVFIGANLMAGDLLIARIALVGILKEVDKYICIAWTITHTI